MFDEIDDIEGIDEETLKDIKEEMAKRTRFNMSDKLEDVVGKSVSKELKEQQTRNLKQIIDDDCGPEEGKSHDLDSTVETLRELVETQDVVTKTARKHMDVDDVIKAAENLNERNSMRSDNGNMDMSDILTTFIYLLLRDHMTAGKLESVVNEIAGGHTTSILASGFLEEYAGKLADTLKNTRTNALAKALENAFGEDKLGGKKKKAKVGEAHLDTDIGVLEKLKNVVESAEIVNTDPTGLINEKADGSLEWPDEEAVRGDFRNHSPACNPVIKKAKGDLDKNLNNPAVPDPLSALEEIKKLVPTDNVKQIADILKAEVERGLGDTRKSILEKRAEVNQEHTATNEGAKQMAEEFIQDAVDEALMTKEAPAEEDIVPVSRGKLTEVANGKAFPDALGEVFEKETILVTV